MRNQRGVTLLGVVIVGFILLLATIVGVKVGPEYMEYYKIVKNIKAVAQDHNLASASPNDIRLAYARRAEIDQIQAVSYKDIDIGRDGGQLVISFSYNKVVPLFANVSLLLEFEGSSAGR